MRTGSFASIWPLKALVDDSSISRIGTRTSLWTRPETYTRLLLGNGSELCGEDSATRGASADRRVACATRAGSNESLAAIIIFPVNSFGYRSRLEEVPFASITWSRFNGSPALPRRTLSLRPATAGPVGSPLDECKIGATTQQVKQWCSSRFSLRNRQASSMSKAASRGGCDTPQ